MRTTTWIGLLASAAIAAACGSRNGTLSLTVRAQASAATATSGGADLGNGIVLSEVRMVVRRLTVLDAEGMAEPAGSARDDADDKRPGLGPFFVDVQGDMVKQGIHPSFDGDVPAGTYAGARISINTVSRKQAEGNASLQAMQALHASIVADGTIDGSSFEFVTPMQVTQAKPGPIVVGTHTTNLTLDVDPSGWFTSPGGTRLDPRDPEDRGAILANIRCSIRLFRDDDRDGLPDDGDDGRVCPAPGVCKVSGTTCTTGTECCSLDCTAGVCQPPTCTPAGGTCTATSACCTGTSCVIPSGSTSGTCQAPACTAAGGTCTATAQCCTGTSCVIPSGSTSGTCQSGVSCPLLGQPCSLTTACCTGLACANEGTSTACSGTGPCACVPSG